LLESLELPADEEHSTVLIPPASFRPLAKPEHVRPPSELNACLKWCVQTLALDICFGYLLWKTESSLYWM